MIISLSSSHSWMFCLFEIIDLAKTADFHSRCRVLIEINRSSHRYWTLSVCSWTAVNLHIFARVIIVVFWEFQTQFCLVLESSMNIHGGASRVRLCARWRRYAAWCDMGLYVFKTVQSNSQMFARLSETGVSLSVVIQHMFGAKGNEKCASISKIN